MAKHPRTVLRDYHLLIARIDDGFQWQIRFGRNAQPAKQSQAVFPTREAAQSAGRQALAECKAERARELDEASPDDPTP